MKNIILGKDPKGKSVEIDLKTLLRTRFLVQAASGGGKSRTLRRLAEQIFGKVPVWIIDKEDEFPSLRDKFGYLFSGHGGETPTDPRTAELVCERLLKAKASAIFGLFNLKDPQRHEWVKVFLNALMNAPKSLWHPIIVMVDESHKFCPEKGQGESVAREAMTDLAVDGRKRGFCAGYFTQRLGKLSKNASAELINRLVGKTVEDIDVDRAVELMSVRRSDREEFEHGIKRLEAGHFWGFGDAISIDRVLIHVGGVQTKHPEPGEPAAAVPPLPEKLKALLPQLADLPKEVETKARTEKELRAEIQTLRAQIARPTAVKTVAAPPQKPIEKIVQKIVKISAVDKATVAYFHRIVKVWSKALNKLKPLELLGARSEKLCQKLLSQVEESFKKGEGLPQQMVKIPMPSPIRMPPKWNPPVKVNLKAVPMPVEDKGTPLNGDAEKPLLAGERKMLEILAQFHPGKRTKAQLAQLSGYTASGGTYGAYFGHLRRDGYVKETGDGLLITEKGLSYFGDNVPQGPKSGDELVSMWKEKLLAGERKMLDVVLGAYPKAISKEELGETSGYTASGGTFGAYLGTLRRNDLIVVEDDHVMASAFFFE